MPNEKNIATFSVDSADYRKYRPTYPPELFGYLAGIAPARELAWDVATGNGQAALALAAYFEKVIANDSSANQLAQARPHPRVEYRHRPGEDAGLADASVDLITVASAIHWLKKDLFFPAAVRALRKGGVFATFNLSVVPEDAEIARLNEAFRKERLAAYQEPGSRDFDAIAFPFAKVEAPAFQTRVEWTLDWFCQHLGTMSSTKRAKEESGADPVGDLGRLLAPLWGDGPQGILLKLRLWVGVNS